MRIDILSVVPELLSSPFSASIMKRAQDKGHLEIYIHNIRDYSTNKQKSVDDYQYGGGAGMVMSIEPIGKAIEELGFYNPITDETHLKFNRIIDRLKQGAKPTDTVRNIFVKAKIFEQI